MTDFVIGDFHHMPRDTQYVHAYQFTANVADQARTMWDGGRGTLTVNAPASVQAMNGFHDQIFCYDVRLQASIPYTFEFSRSGGADAHLLLFRNPGAAAYWAPRSAAEFSTIANQPYTAPTTGAYGVVVIKDNDDLTGGFSLRVSSAVLAVEGSGLPAPTRLDRISPNPARGALRIAYSNAGVTPARFEVLDAAGRVVAHLGETNASRGAAEVVWDRRGLNGAKAPAGLYFVRMLAGGHVVDSRKVALIE